MSMFLPEGSGAASQSGVANVTPASPAVTDKDTALMQRVFAAAVAQPNLIPGDFMAYIVDFIQTVNLLIPIGQIVGFDRFTAQSAPFLIANEGTTSSTYGDLATVGPTLSGLSDGNYVLLYGAAADVATAAPGKEAAMSIQVNSAAVNDQDACVSEVAGFVSVMTARVKTLSNGGSNTVTAKYRSLDNVTQANFVRRWLLAFRYSNL